MILDPAAIDAVAPRLGPGHFFTPAHGTIYRALVAMSAAGTPVELVSLREELKNRGQLESAGGQDYLVRLVDAVPNAANIEYYAGVIADKARRRGLIQAAEAAINAAYDSPEETAAILDQAEASIFALAAQGVSRQAELAAKAVNQIVEQMQRKEPLEGLATGYAELDLLTGGFRPGEMIIIAARPSVGKTALALNMAEYMAVDDHRPVLFFSIEMASAQLARRLLAGRGRVCQSILGRREPTVDEWMRLHAASGDIEAAPLWLDDSPTISMVEIRSKARRLAMSGLACVFIDYLQLITPAPGESRQVQVSDLSRQIKGLARELGIPVICLAQLNRAVEERINHEPRLSDLRESGSIEQDADVVCLLNRPDFYKADAIPNVAELTVAKQRNGPTGKINLTFLRDRTRFENYHSQERNDE
jgi:replicative DNA helicase